MNFQFYIEIQYSATATQELAYKTDALLKRAERAREFSAELAREADEIRRDIERTARDCSPEDRSLCAVVDPSGLHLALRLDRVRIFVSGFDATFRS